MDDDEEADSGLLNISISDSEEDDAAAACSQPQANGKTSEGRTGQSEAGFQAVKASYRPKLDNGHMWQTVKLPLGPRKVPKPEAQEILHAVEELYFFKRYDEAVEFVRRVFDGEGKGEGLDKDIRNVLRVYETKCLGRLGKEA